MCSRRRHALEALKGLLFQRLSMIRVGNVDEGVCTLADTLAEKGGNAVLCDEVVDVPTRGDDASTFLDVGADLADALCCGG